MRAATGAAATDGRGEGSFPPDRYIHLIYLVFLFGDPVFGGGGLLSWLFAILLTAGFAAFYRPLFERPDARWGHALVAVAFVTGFVNPGAAVFYVYAVYVAGAVLPAARLWRLVGLMAFLVVLQGATFLLLSYEIFTLIPLGFSLAFAVVGAVIVAGEAERATYARRLVRAYSEVEKMATIAERERIARDMHDVLGHTLSVVVLKSELARRLAAADPVRAAEEMGSVEVLARQALADVRIAIAGYRVTGLSGELANARLALEAAGIELEEALAPVNASPQAEAALAMILREATTNIIRHSGASRSRIELSESSDGLTLTVSDDGRGGTPAPGTGLNGMKERLEALGGKLEIDGSAGLRLAASLPTGATT